MLNIDTSSPRTSKWCELLQASASGSAIHQKVSQSQPESGQKSCRFKEISVTSTQLLALMREGWRGVTGGKDGKDEWRSGQGMVKIEIVLGGVYIYIKGGLANLRAEG